MEGVPCTDAGADDTNGGGERLRETESDSDGGRERWREAMLSENRGHRPRETELPREGECP